MFLLSLPSPRLKNVIFSLHLPLNWIICTESHRALWLLLFSIRGASNLWSKTPSDPLIHPAPSNPCGESQVCMSSLLHKKKKKPKPLYVYLSNVIFYSHFHLSGRQGRTLLYGPFCGEMRSICWVLPLVFPARSRGYSKGRPLGIGHLPGGRDGPWKMCASYPLALVLINL